MSLRRETPCDFDGICPYDAQYNRDCEYWCGADEPEDEPEPEEDYIDDDVNEAGYNPYLGCFDDDL